MEALNLFWIFFKIGFFCFGGGNAMISVFERLLVTERGYITQAQFADMVAVSQITPGPVAINLATYVGASQGGGALESTLLSFVTTFSLCAPSFIIVITIARFFQKFGESNHVKWVMAGIKPAVIGLIVGSVLLLCRFSIIDINALNDGIISSINFIALFLAILSFVLSYKTEISPLVILLGSGLAGVLLL